MSIVEFNGQQVYKSDYTFAESIALLEIWKAKLIQEKIAAQEQVEAQHSGGVAGGQGTANTTKNKIKPCNNKECSEFFVGEKDGFNCKGHGAVIYCPIYRA